MKLQRAIADYAVLIAVRRRRGQGLEDALRAEEAALQAAQAQVTRAETELGARHAMLADYSERLAERTRTCVSVRLDDLRAARGHRDVLAMRCDEARAQLANAQGVAADAQAACAAARRRIAINEDRMRTLQRQRTAMQARVAREREECEDDERADAMGRRAATA